VLTTILGATTGALGSYNLARFVVTRAVKARRKAKATRDLVADVKAAVAYAKEIKAKVESGEVKPQDVVSKIKALVNESSAS